MHYLKSEIEKMWNYVLLLRIFVLWFTVCCTISQNLGTIMKWEGNRLKNVSRVLNYHLLLRQYGNIKSRKLLPLLLSTSLRNSLFTLRTISENTHFLPHRVNVGFTWIRNLSVWIEIIYIGMSIIIQPNCDWDAVDFNVLSN